MKDEDLEVGLRWPKEPSEPSERGLSHRSQPMPRARAPAVVLAPPPPPAKAPPAVALLPKTGVPKVRFATWWCISLYLAMVRALRTMAMTISRAEICWDGFSGAYRMSGSRCQRP